MPARISPAGICLTLGISADRILFRARRDHGASDEIEELVSQGIFASVSFTEPVHNSHEDVVPPDLVLRFFACASINADNESYFVVATSFPLPFSDRLGPMLALWKPPSSAEE